MIGDQTTALKQSQSLNGDGEETHIVVSPELYESEEFKKLLAANGVGGVTSPPPPTATPNNTPAPTRYPSPRTGSESPRPGPSGVVSSRNQGSVADYDDDLVALETMHEVEDGDGEDDEHKWHLAPPGSGSSRSGH